MGRSPWNSAWSPACCGWSRLERASALLAFQQIRAHVPEAFAVHGAALGDPEVRAQQAAGAFGEVDLIGMPLDCIRLASTLENFITGSS